MRFFRKYEIEIIRLKEGKHSFDFQVGEKFFQHFEGNNIVSQGDIHVEVTVSKEPNLLDVTFNIKGEVKLLCDRSLEEFDYPLTTAHKVLYKYGQEEKEISEEIFMITRDTASINVAQLIYEFVLLAIPLKKIHPDYLDDMDEEDFEEEGKLVYIAGEEDEIEREGKDILSKEDEKVDPRWEVLKKFKKKD